MRDLSLYAYYIKYFITSNKFKTVINNSEIKDRAFNLTLME